MNRSVSPRRAGLLLLTLGLFTAAACGGDSAADPAPASTTAEATTTTERNSTATTTTEVSTTVATTTTAAASTTTSEPPAPVRVMVTNDDGVGAAGIDALVTALAELDGLEITVVAPAEQQSGSGGTTTDGELTAASATTASGFEATAIDGFPADTVIWAIDDGGLPERPDLVISGINEGQNLGPFLDLSGTVGAARAAATRGIPAIAASQGLAAGGTTEPDFEAGAAAVVAYLDEHLDELLAPSSDDATQSVININVPSCASGTSIRGTVEVPAQPVVPDPGLALAPQDCASATEQPAGDVDAFAVGFATISTVSPMPPREAMETRLGIELGDEDLAATVTAAVDDGTVSRLDALAGADLFGGPVLAYTPTTAAPGELDSLWVFAFGYRFAPGVTPPPDGAVPPIDALVPGPVNEALAQAAADVVAEHPMPIIAQWEVARVLEQLGVPNVISVEPDIAADGTVTYLSTVGVTEKGQRLAVEAGVDPGRAGVLCFADHAVRCQMTMRAAGLTAEVPEGVALPNDYDAESGQPWTRERSAYLPTDLLGRSLLPA